MIKNLPFKHYVHPETEERIYEAIYENLENPEIRGSLVGTDSEVNKVFHILKGWKFVYTALANPRAWAVYESNGYKMCFGKEGTPGKDFTLTAKPRTLKKFKSSEIWADRYFKTDDAEQRMVIYNFDKQPREVEGYVFIGRWETDENTQLEFRKNGLQPYAIRYRREKIDWQ